MNNDFFKLLHFADSALPSGGFGFSNGLEGAFQLGIVKGEQSLKNYLLNNLNNNKWMMKIKNKKCQLLASIMS